MTNTNGKENLSQTTASGAALAVCAQIGRTIAQLGAAPALGRMLSPEEYGSFAIVMAMGAFISAFRDLGLMQAATRAKSLNKQQANILFWINVAAATACALFIAGASWSLASVYKDPRIGAMALAIAPVIVLMGLNGQPTVQLYRALRYRTLALRDFSAALSGIAAALIVAIRGGGPWALVAQQWLMAVVTVVWSWIATKWRPGWPRRAVGAGSIVKHGAWLSVSEFVSIGQRSLQRLLLGGILGAGGIGHFDRSVAYSTLPMSNLFMPVSRIAFSSLSTLQDDAVRFSRAILRIASAIGVASAPMFAIAFATGPDGVLILLGRQWTDAGLALRILSPLMLFIGPMLVMNWLLTVFRRGRLQTVMTLVTLSIETVSVVGGAVLDGLQGAVAGMTISGVIVVLPTLALCARSTPVSIRALLTVMIRPVLAGMLGAGTGVAGVWLVRNQDIVIRFITGAAIAGSVTGIAILIDPQMRSSVAYVQSLLRRSGNAAEATLA